MHILHFLGYLRNGEGTTEYSRKACHTAVYQSREDTDLFKGFFSLCMEFKGLWIHIGHTGAHWNRRKRQEERMEGRRENATETMDA